MVHSTNPCRERRERSWLDAKSPEKPTRILLVDDDQDLCDVMREMLEISGFAVLVSDNGLAALKVVEQHPGLIDLLLTDIRMPEMEGPELAQKAKQLRPRMKVLFVSGDASSALATGRLHSDDLVLPKPFSRGTLAEAVQDALRR